MLTRVAWLGSRIGFFVMAMVLIGGCAGPGALSGIQPGEAHQLARAPGAVVSATPSSIPAQESPPPTAIPKATRTPDVAASRPVELANRAETAWLNARGLKATVRVSTRIDNHLVTARVRQDLARPDQLRLEVLDTVPGQVAKGTILTNDDKELSLYEPATSRVFRLSQVSDLTALLLLGVDGCFPFLQMLQVDDLLTSLQDESQVMLRGEEQISGHKAFLLEVVPKAGTRSLAQQLLWIDANTYLPVRLAIYDAQGAIVFSLDYEDLVTSGYASARQFLLAEPPGTREIKADLKAAADALGLRRVTTSEAAREAGFSPLFSRQLPPGITQDTVLAGVVDGRPVVLLLYGDESGTVYIVVETPATSTTVPFGADALIIGTYEGLSWGISGASVVSWNQSRVQLVVISSQSAEDTATFASTLS